MFSSVLAKHYNLSTGQIHWAGSESEYDFYREVANMGYGDMLHDNERNSKYYAAIRKVIQQKRNGRSNMRSDGVTDESKQKENESMDIDYDTDDEIHVLDIGTGTGLLAMMAVEAGADRVTACEAFPPMANCAEGIFKANNYADRIHLIKKSSKNIDLEKDMGGRKANILVAELLDTELIGEGALLTYNHAHENLLTDDVISIPYKAFCYAQVVHSPMAAQWNTLKSLATLNGDIVIKPPKNISKCQGLANLHSIQLSELDRDLFTPLTDPVEIMQIDFSKSTPRNLNNAIEIPLKAKRIGSTDLVFYWWAIQMDREGEIILSCAPYWAHPDYEKELKKKKPTNKNQINWKNIMPWRDHWMQAIYYIPKPVHLSFFDAEKKFILYFNHDTYSLWFNISPPITMPAYSDYSAILAQKAMTQRHSCSCYLHLAYSRTRIGQMNHAIRNKIFIRLLERLPVSRDTHVLIIGDGCVLGLMLGSFGAGKTWVYETGKFSKNFMKNVIEENKLKNVEIIDDFKYISDDALKRIKYVFAEPYFLTSILPWDNFRFGSLLEEIEMNLSEAKIVPSGARVFAMPVIFKDLHKLRAPVFKCEGFDMTLFNEMVENALKREIRKIESHPLWEYPSVALTKPQCLLEFDFRDFCGFVDKSGHFEKTYGKFNFSECNAICLWVDWILDEDLTVTSGPRTPVEVGEIVNWDMYSSQGVYFLHETFAQTGKDINRIDWTLYFNKNYNIITDFKVIYESK